MELSPKQLSALEKFRDAVSDVKRPWDDDGYLLQWLRARNFDLEKAEDMLRKSMAWREESGADTIESWELPEVLRKYYAHGICGVDKEGCPGFTEGFTVLSSESVYDLTLLLSVIIAPSGNADIVGLAKSATIDDMARCSLQMTEKSRREMARQSQKRGKFIGQQILIMDLEGLTFRNAIYPPGHTLVMRLNKSMEENYPECLKRLFVVNAPSFFAYVFNLVKPFMNEYTRSKIFVYDSDRTKWVPALLEFIDPDQLPKHWGGTMVDPDGNPKCPSKIVLGGEVPKSYYMRNKTDDLDEPMEEVTIRKGDQLKLDYLIIQTGSRISWMFQTESHDISFGISLLDVNGEREVVPYQRMDSSNAMIRGQTQSLEEGKYVVTFDNSYSKLRSKHLCYSVQVVPPEEK